MLRWIEGFESFGTTTANAVVGLAQKWDVCSGDSNFTVRAGRVSGQSVRVGTAAPVLGKFVPNNDTFIAGFGFYQDSLAGGPSQILKFYDGVIVQGTLEIQTNGLWKYYRVTGNLLGTSSGSAITTGVWSYIEIKVKIHSSTGTVDIWVDGANVLSLTGQNTNGSGTTQINRVQFTGSQNTNDHTQLDDIYILDNTGSFNNAVLGPRVVKMIVPASDAGTNQYTPDSGSTHYDRLTENPQDSTTYLESTVSDDRELFGMTTLNLKSVAGLQMNTVAKVTDNTVYSLKNSIHTGGGSPTDSDDTAQTVADSNYLTQSRVVETNPETSALWNQTQVNGAQFGFKTG